MAYGEAVDMTAMPNLALDEITIARKVMAERVKLFTDRMVAGALISPLGTALLAGIEGPVAGWDRAAVWFFVINAVEFLIVGMGYRYRMVKPAEGDAPRWRNTQIVCAALLGPAWGSSVWFFWVDGQILFYVVNLTVLVCVSSVTLIILSPFRSAAVLFFAGILFPPLLHLAFVANPLVAQVAAGLSVLFVVQLRYAQVTEGQLLGELNNSVRNLALAEQLNESEERFRLAMEAASDGVWDWDLIAENRCYFSPAYFQMLGYEPSALPMVAETWADLIHPEDHQRVLSVNQDCIENRRPSFEVEYRMKAKDGSWKWILGRGKAVLRDANGKAIRMIGTHVDITERKRSEDALREQEEFFRLIAENIGDFIAVLDLEGRRIYNSPSYRNFFGTARDLRGTDSFAEIHPEDQERVKRVFRETVQTGIGQKIEYRFIRPDGSIRQMESLGGVIRHNDGQVVRVVVVSHDVTERKQMEQQLRIAAAAFESQEGMVVTDPDNIVLRVNAAFSKITGYTAEEAIGRDMNFLKSDRHGPDFYVSMWKSILSDGAWQGEIWNRIKNGEVHPHWITISAVTNSDDIVTHYIGSYIDITERKQMEEQVHLMAFYDALSKLPNRRLLYDHLSQTMAASKRSGCYGALMFLDLDNFKPLNDAHGHVVGDMLLIEVANRLKGCVREVDTVSRFGGDEFVVLINELDADKAKSAAQAGLIAEKIRIRLSEPYQLAIGSEGKVDTTIEHRCSTSIGITLFINHEASQDDLLKWADAAMYQAKEAGRNLIRFSDSIT